MFAWISYSSSIFFTQISSVQFWMFHTFIRNQQETVSGFLFKLRSTLVFFFFKVNLKIA